VFLNFERANVFVHRDFSWTPHFIPGNSEASAEIGETQGVRDEKLDFDNATLLVTGNSVFKSRRAD
jgi:hypothetical protein